VLVGEGTDGRKKRIVGSLTLSRYGHAKKSQHVRVLGMPVIKDYRRAGIGTKMLERALKWAARRPDVEKVVWSFRATRARPPALPEIRLRGGGCEGRQYYIGGKQVDEIDMALFLK
jgi:GNAT superfamily N-acetyltransferase